MALLSVKELYVKCVRCGMRFGVHRGTEPLRCPPPPEKWDGRRPEYNDTYWAISGTTFCALPKRLELPKGV